MSRQKNELSFRIISKTHGKEPWQANSLAGMALAWEGREMVEWVGGETSSRSSLPRGA
jgi:hypothetical protein